MAGGVGLDVTLSGAFAEHEGTFGLVALFVGLRRVVSACRGPG